MCDVVIRCGCCREEADECSRLYVLSDHRDIDIVGCDKCMCDVQSDDMPFKTACECGNCVNETDVYTYTMFFKKGAKTATYCDKCIGQYIDVKTYRNVEV